MENDCDCENYAQNFNLMIHFFQEKYLKFLKINGKDIKSNTSFKNMGNDYEFLLTITKNLVPKGNECIEIIKQCSHNHSKEIEDIKSKLDKNENIIEKINFHFELIKKQIKLEDFDYEENEEEKTKEQNDNVNNNINITISKHLSEKDKINNLRKSAILIHNLFEDEDYKKKKNEDKKLLIKIQNNVKDIIKETGVEIKKHDEILDNIEVKVENSLDKAEKTVDYNLIKSAESAVQKRRLKYQLALGAAFCAAGTIVPGIGNLIGGALGGLIGYGIYRIDKHRLKKLDKKHKDKNKEKK